MILTCFIMTGEKRYDSREETLYFSPENLVPNSNGNKKSFMWKF